MDFVSYWVLTVFFDVLLEACTVSVCPDLVHQKLNFKCSTSSLDLDDII